MNAAVLQRSVLGSEVGAVQYKNKNLCIFMPRASHVCIQKDKEVEERINDETFCSPPK